LPRRPPVACEALMPPEVGLLTPPTDWEVALLETVGLPPAQPGARAPAVEWDVSPVWPAPTTVGLNRPGATTPGD
jgi:hypothetical protein